MEQQSRNFALIGVAGYIAPRHLKAIQQTGNQLIVAMDPHDSVGILDSYFPKARFFTEIERFDRHLEKLRRRSDTEQAHYVSICSPNYLHDAHVRLALRVHAHAICEKPLVVNPWNLEALEDLESEYGRRVYTVLQLRLHPALVALKQRLAEQPARERADIVLTYVTRRGYWYQASWKSKEEHSGGLVVNIGIHFFDLLIWLFGTPQEVAVHLRQPTRVAGRLELERARVRWFLSIEEDDLPAATRAAGKPAFRSLQVDGQEVEFSEGFTDLHTRVYEDILAGRGFSIADTRPSIQAVYEVRKQVVTTPGPDAHPLLSNR